MGSRIAVVIPALDCARSIGAVVAGVRAAMPGTPVVVVDDGSTDATADEAAAAGAEVLRHPRRRGKGAALATGFGWALRRGADAAATLDGDGQHDPAELPRLVAVHERTPRALVIGARQIHDRGGPMPGWNQFGNRSSTFWIGLFAGQKLEDSQSGFRIYPRPLIEVPARTRGFETETELLLRAAKLGLPIESVSIRTLYQPPEERVTHFRPWQDAFRILGLVLRQTRWKA